MTDEQKGAVKCNAVLGGIAALAGGMQALFDLINDRPTGPAAQLLLGGGGALILMAFVVARMRAAAWLSLAVVVGLLGLAHYWAFRDGLHWPGFPRVIKAGLVLLFLEGLAIWAVVVQWRACRPSPPA
jgi:hypothetical protein